MLNELRDVLLREGQQQVFVDQAVAPKAAKHSHHRLVVDQLAVAGAKHDGDRAGDARARDVVKQLGRRIVGPVDVIEEHQRRGALCRAVGDQLDDRAKQAVPAVLEVGRVAKLGQERRQRRTTLGYDFGRKLAERVDPRSVRSTAFCFVRGRFEHRGSAATCLIAQLSEQPRLSDARLALEQKHLQSSSGCAVQDRQQTTTFLLASDERVVSARRRCRRHTGRGGRVSFDRYGRCARFGSTATADLTPRGFEWTGWLGSKLLQHARSALVLGLGFVGSTGPRQQSNQTGTHVLVERVDSDQFTGMRKCVCRIRFELVDQRAENLDV